MRLMLVDDQMGLKIETMTKRAKAAQTFFFSYALKCHKLMKTSSSSLCSYVVMGGILQENYREKETEKWWNQSIELQCK